VVSIPFLCASTSLTRGSAISLDYDLPYQPQTPGFANTNCPNDFRAQIFFPSCWDGKNLDSPDHKSHVAYPSGMDHGDCPSTHPVRLVSIFYELWFYTQPFNKLNDGGRFVVSTGDPTGYSLHGDFMNGWDNQVLQRAMDSCTSDSGVIEDCGVFQNEGRFYTDAETNACSAPDPYPQEAVSEGQVMPHLPGCVAVTEGPGPASPADLVPGCKALGVGGSGNASAASSGVPTSTSHPVYNSPSLALPSSGVPTSVALPASKLSSPALPGTAPSLSSSSKNPISTPPTTPMPSSHIPKMSPTNYASGSQVNSGSPVLAASPTTTGHYYEGGGCRAHNASPTSSMATHRRHHVKRRNYF
jgi:Domain of unknown function (DUF1996)